MWYVIIGVVFTILWLLLTIPKKPKKVKDEVIVAYYADGWKFKLEEKHTPEYGQTQTAIKHL